MAWWIEVRCEKSSDAPTKKWSGDETCWSHDNVGGGMLANDTYKDLNSTARYISVELKRCGWELTKHGWVCPFCINYWGKNKSDNEDRS
jgi:hypothetical protein